MGKQRALADSATPDAIPADTNSLNLPNRKNLSGVTTSRPSYSFSRAGSSKSTPPASRSASRSSSPKKRTTKTAIAKTASHELTSDSHKKAHVEAITKSAPFHSKTSLTPRSIELFNNTPTSPIHVLNFSAATPSQTSTTLSNVHVSGEFRASDKPKDQTRQPDTPHISLSGVHNSPPPPTTGQPIEPIMEIEPETERDSRMGMENGFENSPMARLVKEYSGDADDLEAAGIPTETNINLLLDVPELSPDMIVDRGSERDRGLPRYHLNTLNFDRMTAVVTEQQIFLERAAALIMERTNYFKIDPGDTLLPILQGTSSLAQLRAAWLALRHRIELGTKAWKKYIAEYQLPIDAKPTLSPLSTLPELYQPL